MTTTPAHTQLDGEALDARALQVRVLADRSEARGGLDARRRDGAFYTDHDVALHLARRAIGAALLDAAGTSFEDIEDLLTRNADPVEQLLATIAARPEARAAAVAELGRLRVLDPTCGAGAFLAAAWLALAEVDAALDADVVDPSQLHGVDIDPDAIEACRAALDHFTDGRGEHADLRVADAEAAGSLPPADIVLGNPPYVRATSDDRHADLATRGVPNRSAWIVERALEAARPGARVAFVLPISTSCTDAFAPARATWDRTCDPVLTSHFDTIPSTLFRGVVQRISIFEARRRDESRGDGRGDVAPARWYTSRYHRWKRDERGDLLAGIRHVPLPPETVGGSLAKVGTTIEAALLARLFRHAPAGRLFAASAAQERATIRYKRRWSYFLLFTDFVPELWGEDGELRDPSELKAIDVADERDAGVLLATYSSTLFWWYFSVFTDNRNVNRRDLAAFPLPDLSEEARGELVELSIELMAALRASAEVRTCTYRSIGTIRNTYYRQGATRPVLDRIDAVLARAYGMTDAELEFVLGFERRFRS